MSSPDTTLGRWDASKEAISLCIAYEALGNLVNHSLMLFTPSTIILGEVEVRFHSTPHRDLFQIRLLDFVHERGDRSLLGDSISCLRAIEEACNNPTLGPRQSADDLSIAAAALRAWLDSPIRPRLWLSGLGLDVRPTVSRVELLTIAGNQSKHNLSRLTGVSRQVQSMLSAQGHEVALELIPFALDDLREHLGENIVIYYGTWAAELLNNLTWALHSYLEPIYKKHLIDMDGQMPGMYRFRPLPGVESDSPEHFWFHRLLNHARRQPCVRPFKCPSYLKEQCSLEWED